MRAAFVLALLLAAACAAAAPGATPSASDLPQSDIFTPSGKLTALTAGMTYQAPAFPLAIRMTAFGQGWSGAQWKANTWSPEEIAQRHLHCPQVCKPPYYGWVAVATGSTAAIPRGLIVIMTAYASTPSVAATVAALHRGSGVVYQPPTQTTLAGFTVTQFDGYTTGAEHYFIPFSPPSHGAAGSAADQIEMKGAGHPFRFIVFSVRSKTVVVLVGSLVLDTNQFGAFQRQADSLLASLKFPA